MKNISKRILSILLILCLSFTLVYSDTQEVKALALVDDILIFGGACLLLYLGYTVIDNVEDSNLSLDDIGQGMYNFSSGVIDSLKSLANSAEQGVDYVIDGAKSLYAKLSTAAQSAYDNLSDLLRINDMSHNEYLAYLQAIEDYLHSNDTPVYIPTSYEDGFGTAKIVGGKLDGVKYNTVYANDVLDFNNHYYTSNPSEFSLSKNLVPIVDNLVPQYYSGDVSKADYYRYYFQDNGVERFYGLLRKRATSDTASYELIYSHISGAVQQYGTFSYGYDSTPEIVTFPIGFVPNLYLIKLVSPDRTSEFLFGTLNSAGKFYNHTYTSAFVSDIGEDYYSVGVSDFVGGEYIFSVDNSLISPSLSIPEGETADITLGIPRTVSDLGDLVDTSNRNGSVETTTKEIIDTTTGEKTTTSVVGKTYDNTKTEAETIAQSDSLINSISSIVMPDILPNTFNKLLNIDTTQKEPPFIKINIHKILNASTSRISPNFNNEFEDKDSIFIDFGILNNFEFSGIPLINYFRNIIGFGFIFSTALYIKKKIYPSDSI